MGGSTRLHVWAALIGHSGLGGGMLREYGGSWRELEGVKGVAMRIRRHLLIPGLSLAYQAIMVLLSLLQADARLA